MKNIQYTIAEYLYIHTDAELIRIAGVILGTNKLNLTLTEAVATIRDNYTYTGERQAA